MKWERKYAAWAEIRAGVLEDVDHPGDLMRVVQASVIRRLRETLQREGAVEAGPVEIRVTDSQWGPRAMAVLAECRAIVLGQPNPFPPVRLFRWLPS